MAAEVALVVSCLLGVTILARGAYGGFLSKFPTFYSYLAYFLVTGVAIYMVWALAPQRYAIFFWLRFLTLVLAEFALLVEIGDHLFETYPVLRFLGRAITLGIAGVFFALYIFPALLKPQPTDVAVFELVKRSALCKGLIIVALFAGARHYGVHLGRNAAGIALGLATYLAIHMANLTLAEHFGREVYGGVFLVVGPVSQILTLIIWTFALWRYEPAKRYGLSSASPAGVPPANLADKLGRYNSALDRLLRK